MMQSHYGARRSAPSRMIDQDVIPEYVTDMFQSLVQRISEGGPSLPRALSVTLNYVWGSMTEQLQGLKDRIVQLESSAEATASHENNNMLLFAKLNRLETEVGALRADMQRMRNHVGL